MEEEKYYSLLLEAEKIGLMGSWEKNLKTGKLIWSDGLYNIYGLEPGSISLTTEFYVSHYIHPDDREKTLMHIRSIYKGSSEPAEYRIVTEEGEKTLLSQPSPRLEENICRGVVRDITQQKKNEKEIVEQSEELIHLKVEQQKQALNAILLALEQERARIGEELHDGVAQLLFAIQTRLQLLKPAPKDKKHIRELLEITSAAITDTRNISFELVPSVLRDYGIEKALGALFKRIFKNKPQLEFECVGLENRLNGNLEFAVYRIVQELVNNVLRHSKASKVFVGIQLQRGKMLIRVIDNGIGYNQKQVKDKAPGTGVQSIKNRVLLLDGKLHVISPKGKGTKITICIPLN